MEISSLKWQKLGVLWKSKEKKIVKVSWVAGYEYSIRFWPHTDEGPIQIFSLEKAKSTRLTKLNKMADLKYHIDFQLGLSLVSANKIRYQIWLCLEH